MSNFFKQYAPYLAAGPGAARQAVLGETIRRIVERERQRKEAEALRVRQEQGERAAIYNRAALTVGAHQAQQHARALADAALATPGEKPEVEVGAQAQRRRKTAAIRI